MATEIANTIAKSIILFLTDALDGDEFMHAATRMPAIAGEKDAIMLSSLTLGTK